VDHQDESPAGPSLPARPVRSRPAYVALQESAQGLGDRLGRTLSGLPDALRNWDDRQRSTSFVPDSDRVVLDVRRHPFLLVWPLLRSLLGLLVLVVGPSLPLLLLFAAVSAVWAYVRFGQGVRRTAVVAGVATAALVLVPAVAGASLAGLLLLLLAVEDVSDWLLDRLVVTDRRIYRRYGVLTRKTPSIALQSIAFIDGEVPPVGRLLGYGTLRLDSVAQRDAPLARLDLVPDVTAVTHEILRLRQKAMPKYPQQPL